VWFDILSRRRDSQHGSQDNFCCHRIPAWLYPFGYLLVKYVFTSGEDVRDIGSGGTGATNVARRTGAKGGLLTYVLDVAKGVAAVLLMRMVADDDFCGLEPPRLPQSSVTSFQFFWDSEVAKGWQPA
jgi:hypothetical protein